MYTLLVTGDVPGASTYFNPLLNQTTVPCTSGTRPSSPGDGMKIYETDTKYFRSWDATNTAWQIKGVNDATFPMVWRFGNGSSSDVTGIGSTETTVLTVPSATYKANRAYRLEYFGGTSVTVSNNTPNMKVRKTNTSGQILSQIRVACLASSTMNGFHASQIFTVGGSDVTAAMVLTCTGSGSYNASVVGSQEVTGLQFYEVGAASTYAWATVLT